MAATQLALSPEAKKEAEVLITRYPSRMAALIPILHIAQREFGYISPEAETLVAEILEIPPTHVHGVVSFYTMFLQKPIGKYHLQLCTNIACRLNDAEDLMAHLKQKLGIATGETTPDGRFTLIAVECLGACGSGPVVQINDDYHENLTKEKLDEILAKLP